MTVTGPTAEGAAALLTASEAERLVEKLRPLTVEQVGGEAWQEQHDAVVALNLQAHHCASSNADEFVKEALVLHDKLRVLVFDLLAFEVWQARVLPLLWGHLASEVDSVAAYDLLYHEAALVNLLEVTLFHGDACEALSEDAALELVDWAARKLLRLNSPAGRAFAKARGMLFYFASGDKAVQPNHPERSPKDLLELSAEAQLRRQAAEIEFCAALCSLTILRYLTDRMTELPLSVAARMIAPNDTPALLAALLDEPPWERRVKGKGLQRWEGGGWAAADRLRLSQCDIQAWLALGNLLLEPATRGRYDLDGPRTASLVRLRRLLHEAVLEQLSVARDVARLLDALDAGQELQNRDTDHARLIMEQVPVMRQAILDSVADWAGLAERQRRTVFAVGAAEALPAARRRSDRMLAAIDLMCDMDAARTAADNGADEQVPQPAADLEVRMTAEVQLSSGVYGDWAAYELRIDATADDEQVSVPGLDGGEPIQGVRRRLQAVDAAAVGKVLPSLGRLSIAHGGRRVQAKLALPAAETRDASGLAEVVWITAGRLAVEGLALQLKLQKLARCSERDKTAGTWHAYQIVGGACAVAAGSHGKAADAGGGNAEKNDGRTALNF